MASKGYLYALVRYNSLLRARQWGALIPNEFFQDIIPDDSQLNDALNYWNSTGFFPFRDLRDKDSNGNDRNEVPSREINFIRLVYVRARDSDKNEKSIGVKDLDPFVEGFNTTVLIIDGKLSHDATIMTYQRFPYVYKFSDFITNDSIYDSPSYPISDDVLYSLSQSANCVRREQIIPLQHRELPLYTPKDNVPYLRFMKSEKMIFETLRSATIPGSYDMINYRYVGENYRMTTEELNRRDEEKEEKRQMREAERKSRKKGKKDKSTTPFVPSLSSSYIPQDSPGYVLSQHERQNLLEQVINSDNYFI